MGRRGRADRELRVVICHFHSLLCRLSRASAGVVGTGFPRCVCDCAPLFPEGVAVRPEELNEFFRPLLACVVLRGLAPAPLEALLLQRPLFWNVSFENLEPADLFDGFNAIRIFCVTG
jgi:hypothetical protein